MKRLPHHLTQQNGIFYFRLRIPSDLLPYLNQKTIKRSLNTSSTSTAQILSYSYSALYNAAFHLLRVAAMPKPLLDDVLRSLQGSTTRTYEIELPNGLKIKAEGQEDHNRAMEAIQQIQSLNIVNNSPSAPLNNTNILNYKLEEVIDFYFESFEDNVVKTRLIRKKSLSEFVEYFNENKTATRFLLNHIKSAFVEEYIKFLKSKELSIKTKTNKISYIKVFFDYAIKLEYYQYDKNPAENLVRVSKKDIKASAENGFVAFTKEELTQIYNIENLKNIGKEVRWGMLLGLYTGARVSEIGQLRIDDFYFIDGILCVKICDDYEEQSLKNSASKRNLPIHKDLLSLGILERIEDLKKSNQVQFFPSATKTINGYGNWLSKAFTRFLNMNLKLDKSKKYGFHSLRKNIVYKLQDFDIPEEKRIQYLGHEGSGSVHSTNYSRKYTEKELFEIVNISLSNNFNFVEIKKLLF
jgi:integrase